MSMNKINLSTCQCNFCSLDRSDEHSWKHSYNMAGMSKGSIWKKENIRKSIINTIYEKIYIMCLFSILFTYNNVTCYKSTFFTLQYVIVFCMWEIYIQITIIQIIIINMRTIIYVLITNKYSKIKENDFSLQRCN